MLVIDYSWKNRDKAEIKQSIADYHFQSSSPSFYEGWVGSYLTVPLLGGKQSSNHPGPNAINHCLPSIISLIKLLSPNLDPPWFSMSTLHILIQQICMVSTSNI